uniref:C-type lectin domain-containing protein n=1 Tax=Leptobrachium leishanense TaxID=445787 RepID=A0A8C5R486_9ANUR
MKCLNDFLFVLLLIFPSLTVAGPLHAQCRLEWNFGISCNNVYVALVTQIKLWTSKDNCKQGGERCLYELESANEHYIVAKHTNLIHQYVDNLTFKLVPFEEISCQVRAFSVSEPWYIMMDNGINYCNLHNLVEGSGLDAVPGYSESTNDFKCTQYSSANCTIY